MARVEAASRQEAASQDGPAVPEAVAVPETAAVPEAVAVPETAAVLEAAAVPETAAVPVPEADAEIVAGAVVAGAVVAGAASRPKGGLDRRRYFDIMGAAPTAVTIVTTLDESGRSDGRGRDHGGRPVGLTVSAVTSISAEPPILAVCLDVLSRTLPVVVRAGRFAVNFLRGDRGALAERFASPVADRFAGVVWRPGALGVPILIEDALAHAECRVEGTMAVGDHVVVLGLVVAGSPPPPGSRPLMYFRHAFSSWAGPVEDARHGGAGRGG